MSIVVGPIVEHLRCGCRVTTDLRTLVRVCSRHRSRGWRVGEWAYAQKPKGGQPPGLMADAKGAGKVSIHE